MTYETELSTYSPRRVALGVIAFCSLSWAGHFYLVGRAFTL
jgi:hypothetical protein